MLLGSHRQHRSSTHIDADLLTFSHSDCYERRSPSLRNQWVMRWSHDKASHLTAGALAERAVATGDLSQRQMVIKKQGDETPKERHKRQIRNRMVYNDWGLHGFVQMLELKCISMCFEGQTL